MKETDNESNINNRSNELALIILKSAIKAGTLSDAHKEELSELVDADVRPKIAKTFEVVPEITLELCKLSPERQAKLLSVLAERFRKQAKHYKRPDNINFTEVKAALEAYPAFISSLAKMEQTGGSPDVISIENDDFIFADCSVESPSRRGLDYDKSARMAKRFGVEMMSEEIYLEMQRMGKFDMTTWSWLATSDDIRESGNAMFGNRDLGDVSVRQNYACNSYNYNGWRGVLRVPKV